MAFIEPAYVERRRYRDLRAPPRQALGELQAGLAHVDRAVYVGLRNVEHFARALDFRHAREDRHGHARRRTTVARKQRMIVFRQNHLQPILPPIG